MRARPSKDSTKPRTSDKADRADASPDGGGLFAQLLALSRAAHRAGQREVAYHALTAAMHAANDASDLAGLEQVAAEAREQIAWIDANDPEHRISTASAGRHRHPGVYPMLAKQAETHAEMLRRDVKQHHVTG